MAEQPATHPLLQMFHTLHKSRSKSALVHVQYSSSRRDYMHDPITRGVTEGGGGERSNTTISITDQILFNRLINQCLRVFDSRTPETEGCLPPPHSPSFLRERLCQRKQPADVERSTVRTRSQHGEGGEASRRKRGKTFHAQARSDGGPHRNGARAKFGGPFKPNAHVPSPQAAMPAHSPAALLSRPQIARPPAMLPGAAAAAATARAQPQRLAQQHEGASSSPAHRARRWRERSPRHVSGHASSPLPPGDSLTARPRPPRMGVNFLSCRPSPSSAGGVRDTRKVARSRSGSLRARERDPASRGRWTGRRPAPPPSSRSGDYRQALG